jgi:hypothetical protein
MQAPMFGAIGDAIPPVTFSWRNVPKSEGTGIRLFVFPLSLVTLSPEMFAEPFALMCAFFSSLIGSALYPYENRSAQAGG